MCNKPGPTYDHLPSREWEHVPVWGMPALVEYSLRRISCAEHGVRVEALPWSEGKRPWTRAMLVFLARLGLAWWPAFGL